MICCCYVCLTNVFILLNLNESEGCGPQKIITVRNTLFHKSDGSFIVLILLEEDRNVKLVLKVDFEYKRFIICRVGMSLGDNM